MRRYAISLGDLPERGGEDYGAWDGDTPEAALLACRRDADRTRPVPAVRHLSDAAAYGRGSDALNGNGADDRSDWWYVRALDTGRLGVYALEEPER
jgi:hypothetical protein